MLKVSTFTDARLRIPKAAEIVAASAVAVAHEVAGWLLIVFAILIVAVAGPKRGSRVFAVLFATVIVLVVLSGCSPPDAALPLESGAGHIAGATAGTAGTVAGATVPAGTAGVAVAGAVAAAAVIVVAAARLAATALNALAGAIRGLMWTALTLAVLVSVLVRST
ncbi:hypothetical protein [Cryptosporangium sp. NPDC048952]|uniref:hypothetical protein n=1 Tax=Cryptosporangium sp. NPDC048952 TaxID=3363961 RepID=UPI00371FA755